MRGDAVACCGETMTVRDATRLRRLASLPKADDDEQDDEQGVKPDPAQSDRVPALPTGRN